MTQVPDRPSPNPTGARMKLSLSTASLYVYPLSLTFRIAEEVGFDGVELVVNPEVLLRGADRVRRLASRHGLTIYSVHPPLGPTGGRHDNSNPSSRVAKISRDLGCSLMVAHVPRTETRDSVLWNQYLTSLEQALSILDGSNTRVALENRAPSDDGRTFVLSDLRDLRAFADEYDLPIVLDTTHTVGTGHSVLEAYEIVAERLRNVHLSDWRRPPRPLAHPRFNDLVKQHQMPGSGEVPLGSFVTRLAQDEYDGLITSEVSPFALKAWSPKRARSNLRRCVSFVKRFWVRS